MRRPLEGRVKDNSKKEGKNSATRDNEGKRKKFFFPERDPCQSQTKNAKKKNLGEGRGRKKRKDARENHQWGPNAAPRKTVEGVKSWEKRVLFRGKFVPFEPVF